MQNPAYTHPPEYTDTATIPVVTITIDSDDSDTKDSFEVQIAACTQGKAEFEAHYHAEMQSYLEPGTHQPEFPTPPSTPSDDTDLTPPALIHCRISLGEDWKYNDQLKYSYYCYLIPSPETGKFVVASWIKFNLLQASPKVSAIFRKYHSKYLKILCSTPVEYNTRIISPKQAHLFHTEEAFAPAINIILAKLCPPDIEAGIYHYRYHHTMIKAYQDTISDAQNKYIKYLKHMMEVLEDLEKADTSNWLAVLIKCAKHSTIPNLMCFRLLAMSLRVIHTATTICPTTIHLLHGFIQSTLGKIKQTTNSGPTSTKPISHQPASAPAPAPAPASLPYSVPHTRFLTPSLVILLIVHP